MILLQLKGPEHQGMAIGLDKNDIEELHVKRQLPISNSKENVKLILKERPKPVVEYMMDTEGKYQGLNINVDQLWVDRITSDGGVHSPSLDISEDTTITFFYAETEEQLIKDAKAAYPHLKEEGDA